MKIIVIDTSHNSSLVKVKAFLTLHIDADIIFTFDYMYYRYSSAAELNSDMDELTEEFFSNPCAYYDCITSILGKIRKLHVDSIIIFSRQIDECSRLSSEYLYDCNIQHFEIYHPGILDINYSAIVTAPPLHKFVFESPLKCIIQKLSQWDPFRLDNEDEEYYQLCYPEEE